MGSWYTSSELWQLPILGQQMSNDALENHLDRRRLTQWMKALRRT